MGSSSIHPATPAAWFRYLDMSSSAAFPPDTVAAALWIWICAPGKNLSQCYSIHDTVYIYIYIYTYALNCQIGSANVPQFMLYVCIWYLCIYIYTYHIYIYIIIYHYMLSHIYILYIIYYIYHYIYRSLYIIIDFDMISYDIFKLQHSENDPSLSLENFRSPEFRVDLTNSPRYKPRYENLPSSTRKGPMTPQSLSKPGRFTIFVSETGVSIHKKKFRKGWNNWFLCI